MLTEPLNKDRSRAIHTPFPFSGHPDPNTTLITTGNATKNTRRCWWKKDTPAAATMQLCIVEEGRTGDERKDGKGAHRAHLRDRPQLGRHLRACNLRDVGSSVSGRGEAAPTSYYGQDAQGVAAALEASRPGTPGTSRAPSRATTRCPPSALTALDNAMHDLAPGGSACRSTVCSGSPGPYQSLHTPWHSRQGDDRRPCQEVAGAPDPEGKDRRMEGRRDAQGREGVIGGGLWLTPTRPSP